ncbi:MAG: hypothetical protein RJA98_1822 [Pseudomonadota bacterium]|jgi:cytochrome P450
MRAMDPTPAHPPGPPRRWLGLPQLRAFAKNYLGATQKLRDAHGDVACMHIGREHSVDVFTPDLMRIALVDHAEHLVRWERGPAAFAASQGQGLLVAEGEAWAQQRRCLQPGFTPKRVATYLPLMVGACANALDHLRDADLPTLDVDACLTRLTMDVILRTLFSAPASADTSEVAAAVRALGQLAMADMLLPFKRPAWWPHPNRARRRWALHTVDTLIWTHIRARQQLSAEHRAAHTDLLAMLMSAVDDARRPLSDQALRDQCMTLFQAGHDTTASALTWWAWALAAHPEVAQAARAEVDTVLQGRPPEAHDLAHLPQLEQSIKESLRLYPPVPALMNRRTTAPLQLGPWTIPKGWLLRLTPWVLHHDAAHFPEPERFNPARFAADATPPIPRGAYLPFGTGPRVCIGQQFAMSEMLLIAAMLLQRFEWQPLAGAAEPVPHLNVTLRPKDGLTLAFKRRGTPPPAVPTAPSRPAVATQGGRADRSAAPLCRQAHAKGGWHSTGSARSGHALGALAPLKGH